MSDVDVAVIGGGPVGLATAIRARMAGFRVRLLDRRRPPIDKPCGEGLMPEGVAALGTLGVDTQELGRRFTGIRYIDGDLDATGLFPGEAGLGIRRLKLHEMLASRAASLAVDLGWGVKVEGIDGRRVRTSTGDFTCEWIVGADGLHSSVRKWLGVPVVTRSRRFAVRRHYAVEPWSDVVEVWWGRDCEAYVTPVGDHEVGVAFLWSQAKARFSSLLEQFPRLARRLTGAPATSKDLGAGPLWNMPKRITVGRVALAGDAAGYLDAITGEGLSLGFRQAGLVVHAFSTGDLGWYEAAARRARRWPFAMIRVLLYLERHPRIRRRTIRSLAADPELFSRILSLQTGELSPLRLGIGRTGRLLLSLARRD